MIKLLPLLLITTLQTARCSLVMDSMYQKGIYLSDYCPNMKYCKEGSHVMCMYYDPNRPMGPNCHMSAFNVSMTSEYANQLLDVMNAIRSKIARGKETGKGGALLPRGYGIFRVRWDNELATFAQIWTNQCILRLDMCRATKRFHDPGQIAGLIRFTYPQWSPLSSRENNAPTGGLNNLLIANAVTKALKSWYKHKMAVTDQMIKSYPDWTLTPNNQMGKQYMEMIYSSITHVGCGMSAYTEYSYNDNKNQGIFNSIQIICNFSSRPHKGSAVFRTDPPMPGQGYSAECGCPPNSREDSDCLCNEEPPPIRSQPEPICTSDQAGNCEPTLVLLPIFTLEDAPPEKLYEKAEDIKDPLRNYILQRMDVTTEVSKKSRASMEFYNLLNDDKENEREPVLPVPRSVKSKAQSMQYDVVRVPPPKLPKKSIRELPPLPPPRSAPTPPPRRRPSLPPRARPYSKKTTRDPPPPSIPPPPPPLPPPLPPPRRELPTPPKKSIATPSIEKFNSILSSNQISRNVDPYELKKRPLPKLPPKLHQVKKTSIFTKVAQFKLPDTKPKPLEVIKKDVEPRKDFSNINKIVDEYMNRRSLSNKKDEYKIDLKPSEAKLQSEYNTHKEETITETVLKKVEEKVINYNEYLKQRSNASFHNKDIDIKDDNDNILMSLLDNLEREVKHVAIDGTEKEIIDAKIRKIYGTVVSKSTVPPTPLPPPPPPLPYDQETPDINTLDTKSNTKRESDQKDVQTLETNLDERKNSHKREPYREELLPERPRKSINLQKPSERLKDYDYQVHSKKEKFVSSLETNTNNERHIFHDIGKKNSDEYERKYNDYKYIDDVDRKYNENPDRKYYETNHLDRNYNEAQQRSNDDFDQKHRYNVDKRYNDVPPSRSVIKYEPKDLIEFRELKHNPLNSEEEKYRHYQKMYDRESKSRIISANPYRNRDSDRRHRVKGDTDVVKSSRINNEEPLSLERRKYYQNKLDIIERKLSGSRNTRRKSKSRNDRPMRRMRPSRDDQPKSKQKSQADNFYIPERARFLHGF